MALTVAGMATALMTLMVAPVLPTLQREFHVGADASMWVLTVFMITTAIATPIFGRLGDMFGKDRVIVLVLVVYALGTLVCALAPSLGVLVTGRAVQGTGGALFPLAFGVIRDEFPRRLVTLGVGVMSAMTGIGGATGLVFSGIITDRLGYSWLFWVGLIVTVPAIVAVSLFVPASPVRTPARIDWVGGLLMLVGLSALLLGVTEVGLEGLLSPAVLGLFAAAAVLLLAWTAHELRVPEPLVDMRLMRERRVWTTNLAAYMLGFAMQVSILMLPQLVQVPRSGDFGFGATATEAGLYLVPHALAIMIAAPIAGWLGQRLGSRIPLLISIGIALAGLLQIIFLHDRPWEITLHAFTSGFSVGMAFAAMVNLILGAVPQNQTGMATGMNVITRSIGGAFQAQVSGAILAGTAIAGVLTERGFVITFAVAAGVLVASLVVALLVPRPVRVPA